MTEPVKIKVFLASPGDILEERDLFRESLAKLSEKTPYKFTPSGWEDVHGAVGIRPQGLINDMVDECDVFVGVFHRRWGQAASDVVAYTSYTEEEFERARRRLQETRKPEIFLFFKNVDVDALADPGEQLSKVLNFRRRLERSKQVLYRTYSLAAEFATDLESHLVAFASGTLPSKRTFSRSVHLPELADLEPETHREQDLALANQARIAAQAGRIEEAGILFARLSQASRNVEVLESTRDFFERIGNADAAFSVLERKIRILRDRRVAAREYIAVMMSDQWLNEMVAASIKNVPVAQREGVEGQLRGIFIDERFYELMVEAMAEHLTVGELLALARFYRKEGTITNKMGHFIGSVIPQIIQTMAAEGRM